MKKLLLSIFTLILCLVVFACGKKTPTDENKTQEIKTSETEEITPSEEHTQEPETLEEAKELYPNYLDTYLLSISIQRGYRGVMDVFKNIAAQAKEKISDSKDIQEAKGYMDDAILEIESFLMDLDVEVAQRQKIIDKLNAKIDEINRQSMELYGVKERDIVYTLENSPKIEIYLGKFGDNYVYYPQWKGVTQLALYEDYYITLGDYTIEGLLKNTYDLVVLNNDTEYTATEAFELGLLSNEEVKAIYERNLEIGILIGEIVPIPTE